MHRIRRACQVLAVAGLLFVPVVFADAAEVGVQSLIEHPAQYDGQTVTLHGTAIAVKGTVSRRGNEYTTFKLQNAGGGAVAVFSWGHPALKDGDGVEVTGIFQQAKHVGRYTFYNEVEAQSISPSR